MTVATCLFWAAVVSTTFPRMLTALTPTGGAFGLYAGFNITTLAMIFFVCSRDGEEDSRRAGLHLCHSATYIHAPPVLYCSAMVDHDMDLEEENSYLPSSL